MTRKKWGHFTPNQEVMDLFVKGHGDSRESPGTQEVSLRPKALLRVGLVRNLAVLTEMGSLR